MVERVRNILHHCADIRRLAQLHLTFAGWRLGALMVTMKASACGTSQRLD